MGYRSYTTIDHICCLKIGYPRVNVYVDMEKCKKPTMNVDHFPMEITGCAHRYSFTQQGIAYMR